jgi:hypothetical protein
MISYKNLSGNSGVVAYESGTDYIKLRFKGGSKIYVYDALAPGLTHVEQMKKLAAAGRGLTTYVSQNVRKNYSRIE